jgi:2-hydroxychromene-2-carboxylate isomerase
MSTDRDTAGPPDPALTLWWDPVCPYSWNTAKWLAEVAEARGRVIGWHLMSLAVLNEGQTLPAPQHARMQDSRVIGRLMMAIKAELGQSGLIKAYFGFGEAYFDQDAAVDEHLAEQVLKAAGASETAPSSMWDDSLDAVVRQSHEASQHALGMAGGSPMLTIGGQTFFGPVLTALPEPGGRQALFEAVATLANTPTFSQLQRPRATSQHA